MIEDENIRGPVADIIYIKEALIPEDESCWKFIVDKPKEFIYGPFLGNSYGESPLEKFFDDRVDYWHEQYKGPKPLQEFMGMNDHEWKLFVCKPSEFYKKYGESVKKYLEDK